MRLIVENLARLDHHLARQAAATRAAQRDTLPDGRRASGDELALRGIPVVGVIGGKGGAITGTRPGDSGRRAHTDEIYLTAQRKRRPRR